jgi:hypothetical protein
LFEKLFVALCLLLAITPTAHSNACSLPRNWDKIADFPTKENRDQIAIIIATVADIYRMELSDRSCVAITYKDAKIKFGNADGPYNLALCSSDDDWTRNLLKGEELNDDSDGGRGIFGLYKNARVISILTKQELNQEADRSLKQPEGFFRQMQISCWPSFQFNVASYSDDEIDRHLNKMKTDFENVWEN